MEPLLEIIDDLVPTELFGEACKLSVSKGWYFGNGSHDKGWGSFWKMELEGIAVFDAIWEHARTRCETLAGGSLSVLRQYANGHTYGLGGRPHLDDARPGSYTLLYYPMEEWNMEWDGETVFYDERGEIALSVQPKPNRAVLFDSRILHVGRAPSRSCPALRVTVAYKLQRTSTEAQPRPVAPQGDIERTYVVKVEAARLNQLVEDHLAKMGQTLKLPGFRPGKIPAAVLEQRYGAAAKSEVLKKLAEECVAREVPAGSILCSVDAAVVQGGAEFRISSLHPPSLAEPDLSNVEMVRLTGVSDDASLDHLKQQVLDYLEGAIAFTPPAAMVNREFAAVWQLAQASGATDEAEFRALALRRVRLGIVVAELARRYNVGGADVEEAVIQRLLSGAKIVTRAATADERKELE